MSVYLRDPDGNGLELYYDRPRSAWTDADGRPVLRNDPIALEALLAQGSPSNSASTESSGTPGAGEGTVSPRR